MLPGRPWKKLLHFWYGNFLKKLLVLLNISFLPETTRASFGPHTTNPQVMIKSDESPITLYCIYSRVRSQHSCFVLFLYMYIYHNTQRHSRLVFRNCRCVESLLPILVFTRKHKNSRVVWSTRLFQHLLDRWFGFWGYGGRCRSALTLSLSHFPTGGSLTLSRLLLLLQSSPSLLHRRPPPGRGWLSRDIISRRP